MSSPAQFDPLQAMLQQIIGSGAQQQMQNRPAPNMQMPQPLQTAAQTAAAASPFTPIAQGMVDWATNPRQAFEQTILGRRPSGTILAGAATPSTAASRLAQLFAETPRAATSLETEAAQGGVGHWISPTGTTIPLQPGPDGIATHGQTAMSITGYKTAPAATNSLLRQGYIRVRGPNVQIGQKPIAFDSRLQVALNNARVAGGGRDIQLESPEGTIKIPPHEIGQFLADPKKYMKSNTPIRPSTSYNFR